MSYMWNEFNIKTFPAQTIVYRDGVYCPELSTLENAPIDKKYDQPVHIIYVGEIAGKCRLNIENLADDQPIFLSVKIKNKKPAFLNIFIKNTGKNSEIRGHVLLENSDTLEFNVDCTHSATDTGILIHTKLLANAGSKSKISGNAKIEKDCTNTTSDISFTALADATAKIEFNPAQYISAAPKSAEHSAAIYHATRPQILYLRGAGLNTAEIDDTLRTAFINDFHLF